MWRLDSGWVFDRTEGSHVIRFFLPRELELILELGGFRLLDTIPAGETFRNQIGGKWMRPVLSKASPCYNSGPG